jgi:hypothetical protein
MTMRTACPRTKAPSLKSMSSHVSRTVFRLDRGQDRAHDVDRTITLDDPVGGSREHEDVPITTSNARSTVMHRGVDQFAP